MQKAKPVVMERVEWVVLYGGQLLEMDLVKSLLEGSGVECRLENEVIGTIYPHFSLGGIAPVKILVAREDSRHASAVLRDYLRKKHINVVSSEK